MCQRMGSCLEGPLTVGSSRHAGCPDRGDGGLGSKRGPTAAAGGTRTAAAAASGHGEATGAAGGHTAHGAFLCPGGDNFTAGWGGLGLRG